MQNNFPVSRLHKLFAGASAAALTALGGFWASPAAAQSDPAVTLDEVIVTATKRAENVQDVPIAITVFSETALKNQGADEMQDLSAPNFIFPQTYTSSRSYISVRGIFQEVNTIAFEGGFSSYLDGVYMGRNMSYNVDVADIERVEILRGPQGTLFGKNTIAGVMNIVSRRPGPEFEGRVSAELGNYELRRFRAGANIPIIKDVLATRFSFQSAKRDGYATNSVDGSDAGNIDMQTARGQVQFTPNDQLTVHGSVDFVDSQSRGYVWETVGTPPLSDTKPYTQTSDIVAQELKKDFGASLTAEYRFGNGHMVTSITGYRKSRTRWLEDEDGTTTFYFTSDNRDEQELWSQELRLNSPTDQRLDYVLGLYYFDQTGRYQFDIPFGSAYPGGPFSIVYHGIVDTRSYAAFGHVNFHVTEQLNLFGGLRYTDEEKDFVGDRRVGGSPLVHGPAFINDPVVRQFATEVKAEEISWTVGAQYHLSPDVMIYASAADGFKSGGFNTRDGRPVRPEYLTSYETGIKSTLLDGRMNVNLTAFYSDYQDLQVRSIDAVALVSVLHNAASVTSKGFEVELVARPIQELTLNLGVGYVDSKYDSFKNTTNILGQVFDASGNRLPMTPPWTVNGGAHYEHPLAGGGSLIAHGDFVYIDDRYGITSAGQNSAGYELDSYTIVNARTGYRSADDRWSLEFWAKNLLDSDSEVDRRPLPVVSGLTVQMATYMEPRTYGVTLAVEF